MEALENAAQNQIAPAGPHCVVSGDIVRPRNSQMEIQMLENAPPRQTVLNGLRIVPSGDIVKRTRDQTERLLGVEEGTSKLVAELERRLEEERGGKCQLKNKNLLPQTVNRNQKEMEEAVEEDVVVHVRLVGEVQLEEVVQLKEEEVELEEEEQVLVEEEVELERRLEEGREGK